eukprot:8057852-Ditylum_brightwellii.AAC.1
MLDIDLEVKDGLLAIECSYPSNDDLHELPRVWLMGNEVPWDPTILDEESNIRVLLCWDGSQNLRKPTTMMCRNKMRGISLKTASCKHRKQ